MVVGGPAAERAGRHHAGLEEGPLLVRQQATDQCRSPRQRSAWNHVHARQGIPPSPVCPRDLGKDREPTAYSGLTAFRCNHISYICDAE